jgi:hypothetical protein
MSIETFSAAAEVAERHSENIAEADAVLREICQSGRRPTFAELTFFQREIGWDSIAVQSQLRRVNNVLRLQAIAGTSDDREASVKEASSAAAVLEKEAPKIRERIEKEQKRLDALERDARLSKKRVTEQSEAAEALRTLAPEHIAAAVRSEVQAIKSSIGREIGDSEVRVNELECCLSPDRYQNEAAYLEVLRRSFRTAVSSGTRGSIIRYSLSAEWPAIRSEIETELSELQAKLVELRAEYSEQIAAAELPLNFYAT